MKLLNIIPTKIFHRHRQTQTKKNAKSKTWCAGQGQEDVSGKHHVNRMSDTRLAKITRDGKTQGNSWRWRNSCQSTSQEQEQ